MSDVPVPDNGSPDNGRTVIEIRQAGSADHEILVTLQSRAALENEGDLDALLAHPESISLPMAQINAGQVLVAVTGGSVVGFASLVFRHDSDIELDGLFVEPAKWRNGVGRALIEASCRFAKQLNATALHLVGNPHARDFYAACGFDEIGAEETELGEGILYRRSL